MNNSKAEYLDLINNVSSSLRSDFIERLDQGLLTRDEDPVSHFCCFTAIIDPQKQEVFLGLHKKADLWLFTGGHIDQNEPPAITVHRELREEIGYDPVPFKKLKPSLLTITHIDNPKIKCKTHYDFWYFIHVDKDKFTPEPKALTTEFYETKWLTLAQAYEIVTDSTTRCALDYLSI